MEIEWSNEVRGKVYAYRFDDWEYVFIAKLLKTEIPKLEKKIKKIDAHPDNEGQVTYMVQKEEIYKEINALQKIITEFEKYKPIEKPKNKKSCKVSKTLFD